MLLLRKPYFHGNKNIHKYFVFFSQVKFIFGTLGKRKSINYLVAMETLLSCHSLGDVLICCICSLGQKHPTLGSPPGAGYMVEISPRALSYKSLSNPQIFHQILFYIHCTHTQRRREVKHGCMSHRGLSLKTLNLNQCSQFKMHKKEHKFSV